MELTFTEFRTDSESDFVSIFSCYDIKCHSALRLSKLSGSQTTIPKFSSPTGYMLVEFITDEVGTSTGFHASWTSV